MDEQDYVRNNGTQMCIDACQIFDYWKILWFLC